MAFLNKYHIEPRFRETARPYRQMHFFSPEKRIWLVTDAYAFYGFP